MAEKKKINFNINKNVLADLDKKARENDITRTTLITILIRKYLYKNDEREVILNEKIK